MNVVVQALLIICVTVISIVGIAVWHDVNKK